MAGGHDGGRSRGAGLDVLRRTCPSRSVLARVVGKWTVLVVVALEDGPLRFGELLAAVEGISAKVLTATLRALERDGVVWRRAYPGVPVRVEYGLSPLGRSLGEPLAALQAWAQAHAQEVIRARERYDAAGPPVSAGSPETARGRASSEQN